MVYSRTYCDNHLIRLLDCFCPQTPLIEPRWADIPTTGLVAADHHSEVQERDDDGPGNAYGKERHPGCGRVLGRVILLRVQWVIIDGKGFALLHGNRRGEFITERFRMGIIAKRDDEVVGAGSNAEGEGFHPGEFVAACGDFRLRFQPGD